MLQYAILWLLQHQRDYGYRLKRRFEERMGAVWSLNIGQVYQTLQKLERAGSVRYVPGVGHEHYPARRLFEITPRGTRVLERWLERPFTRPRPMRDESLIRLLAIEDGRQADVVARIAEQEQHCRKHIARLVGQQAAGGSGTGLLVRHLGLEAERLRAEAHLRWLQYSRQCLERPGDDEQRVSA